MPLVPVVKLEVSPTKVTAKRAMHQKAAESQSEVAPQQDETEDQLKTRQQHRENKVGVLW